MLTKLATRFVDLLTAMLEAYAIGLAMGEDNTHIFHSLQVHGKLYDIVIVCDNFRVNRFSEVKGLGQGKEN